MAKPSLSSHLVVGEDGAAPYGSTAPASAVAAACASLSLSGSHGPQMIEPTCMPGAMPVLPGASVTAGDRLLSLRVQWNSGMQISRHCSLAKSKVTVESTKTSVPSMEALNVSVTARTVLVNATLRLGSDWRLLGTAAASVARRVVMVGMKSILGVF